MAMLNWALRRKTSSSSSLAVIGSRPAESSSNNNKAGSRAKARATAARFFIPPLISAGSRWAACSRPTSESFIRARSRAASGLAWVCSTIGRATFSSKFIELNSAPPWNDIPTLRKIASCSSSVARCMSCPLINTWPETGVSRPTICRRSVVLPQPLPPKMTVISPRRARIFTSSRTVRSP